MIFYILFVCCFPHRHYGGTASPLRSLYAITEKGGEHEKRTDGKEAGADKHHDGLAYVVVAPVHLDVDLERGNDNQNRGERVAHVLDIQHVLYFACNYTDNQCYVKSEKGKCSQNDTRIVWLKNEEKGCV